MREIRRGYASAAMMAVLAVGTLARQTHPENKTETRVETRPISFRITYEVTRTVTPGRLLVHQQGKDGEVIDTYTVFFQNGNPYRKKLVSTQTIEPTDQVVYIGTPGFPLSRHYYTRGRSITMRATAYDPSPETIPGTTGRTATGMRAGYGVIAVDPRVIPLGSIVYVEGYGLAIAADTGGAIKGHRIDLCFNARSTALRYGRHTVKMYILHGE